MASGNVRLRIPPARNGDLVRARVGGEEVLLRIRVPAGPTPPGPTTATPTAPGPTASGTTVPGPFGPLHVPQPASTSGSGKSGALGCLLALGVAAAVIIGVAVASSSDDSRPTASATPSSTYSPYTPYTYTPPPYTPPTYTGAPASEPAAAPTYDLPSPSPTTEAPRPFDEGTCLNGQLPDSTTATRVTGVHEVSCGADDAHYRVIERFPGTSDMSRCDQNPDTEYGFSYRYTLGASVLNEYVYCLVGLGSYARH
ncbi:hypothetical protein [Streptomyces sp. NPDC096033]|uniref:LppU/SCO3897 family protein n=1 Tax=Streptomyces sp. NPDC096033 TaxID=3366071 RepID=UPI00381D22CE